MVLQTRRILRRIRLWPLRRALLRRDGRGVRRGGHAAIRRATRFARNIGFTNRPLPLRSGNQVVRTEGRHDRASAFRRNRGRHFRCNLGGGSNRGTARIQNVAILHGRAVVEYWERRHTHARTPAFRKTTRDVGSGGRRRGRRRRKDLENRRRRRLERDFHGLNEKRDLKASTPLFPSSTQWRAKRDEA